MISPIIVSVMLCLSEPDLLEQLQNPAQLRQLQLEILHRMGLENARRMRDNTGIYIKMREKDIRQPNLGPWYKLMYEREIESEKGTWHYLNLSVEVMEWYEQERKRNPGPATDQKASERLKQIMNDWKEWQKAWDAGQIAPMPREVKR